MSVLNSHKVKNRAYNIHLIIALLSMFIAGFLFIFIGLILNHEEASTLIGIQILQNIILFLIILGFIFVTLGIIECILIISKIIRKLDQVFDKVENLRDPNNKRAFLRIVRPDVSINESLPVDHTNAPLKETISTQKVFNEKSEIKESEDPLNKVINISIEEALQKIIDRYNNPKQFNDELSKS